MKRVWVLGSATVAAGAADKREDAAVANTSRDTIGPDKTAGLRICDIVFMG
jgi:hypothetical protein